MSEPRLNPRRDIHSLRPRTGVDSAWVLEREIVIHVAVHDKQRNGLELAGRLVR